MFFAVAKETGFLIPFEKKVYSILKNVNKR